MRSVGVIGLDFSAYKDLDHRKKTREAAWNKPTWEDTVYYTGAL